MPYPNSRNDRAWELFVALVAATKSAAANRSGAEKSIGRILGPFFLESLAREAYIAADAFEKVHREMTSEEHPPAEGDANPALSLGVLNQRSEIPPEAEAAKEMFDALGRGPTANGGADARQYGP
jgi:hypothetical protein